MSRPIGRSVIDWPEGLTVYDRDRACDGYTLLTPFHSPMTYLLDMTGRVVHLWMVPQTIHAKYVGSGQRFHATAAMRLR